MALFNKGFSAGSYIMCICLRAYPKLLKEHAEAATRSMNPDRHVTRSQQSTIAYESPILLYWKEKHLTCIPILSNRSHPVLVPQTSHACASTVFQEATA